MNWIKDNWPWLLAWAIAILQVLPSLLNGLVAEKSWSGRIRVALNWLSHLTPPDKPGTFKRPFSSDPPKA